MNISCKNNGLGKILSDDGGIPADAMCRSLGPSQWRCSSGRGTSGIPVYHEQARPKQMGCKQMVTPLAQPDRNSGPPPGIGAVRRLATL